MNDLFAPAQENEDICAFCGGELNRLGWCPTCDEEDAFLKKNTNPEDHSEYNYE